MQASDFTERSPGKLVPSERGALAFVPDPAPESLELDGASLQALLDAERALGQLTGMVRGMGAQLNTHLLSRPMLRREAIASSRIEGTVTTPEQLVLLEVEGTRGAEPASETREVLNYIEALDHGFARLTGDFLTWVRFFLEGVTASAHEVIRRAEALAALRRKYHAKLSSARSSALLLKLVDSLFELPMVTISRAATLLEVTPASASANLRKLVDAGILTEVSGRVRDQRFLARELLAAAHADE